MLNVLLCILWIFVSLFLVLIILLQRGKGGGLAGALGGVGGSSAFGTKAGDVFTKITVGVFGFWLLLAMILVWSMKSAPKFVGVNAKEKDKAGAKGTEKAGAETKSDADKAKDAAQKKELDDLLKGMESKMNEPKKDAAVSTPPPKSDAKTEPPKTDPAKSVPAKTEPAKTPPKTETPKAGDSTTTTKDDKAAPGKDGAKKP